jgi:hypothetical protein
MSMIGASVSSFFGSLNFLRQVQISPFSLNFNKVGGATKAPDYSFRIGGTRKFFVEAKKPATNLKDASEPAFQLRRYAWSAKLPLCPVPAILDRGTRERT